MLYSRSLLANYFIHSKEKKREVTQSCPTLCNPMAVAYQAPPSMEFSRQEYWSGVPFPSPGDLPNPGIEPGSPTSQADTLPSELPVVVYVNPELLIYPHTHPPPPSPAGNISLLLESVSLLYS